MSGYNFKQKEWSFYPLDECLVGQMVVYALKQSQTMIQLEGWLCNVPNKYALNFDELDWDQLTDPLGKLNDVMLIAHRKRLGYCLLGFESEFMQIDPNWNVRFDYDEKRADLGAHNILKRCICQLLKEYISVRLDDEYKNEKERARQQRIELKAAISKEKMEREKAHPEEQGKIKINLRFMILLRDNFRCRYCGRNSSEVKLQVDHILPKSKGGKDEPSNLITACQDCNLGKKGMLILSNSKKIKDITTKKYGQIPSFMALPG